MPVYRLSKKEISFPDPVLAEENGLLAVGGDLSTERLLLAYLYGIFPWYEPGDERYSGGVRRSGSSSFREKSTSPVR